jgi:orotate phosphoribosyltransferase
MLNEQAIELLFERYGVVKRGHFVYTNGHHGDTYVDKYALFPHAAATSRIASALATLATEGGVEIDAVVGPAIGGVVYANEIALLLSERTEREVFCAYAEHDTEHARMPDGTRWQRQLDTFSIKRVPFKEALAGRRTLIVDDNVTTGGSIKRTTEAAIAARAVVVGGVAMWNRGGVTAAQVGLPYLRSLVNARLASFDVLNGEVCPSCLAGIPIDTTLGHAERFTMSTVS